MPVFLIIIAVFLIIFNIRAIKKEKKSFNKILKEKEKNMTPADIAIGEIRKDMAESLLDLQKEIEDLKDNVKKDRTEENEKVVKVMKLLASGKEVEEICHELNLGKGEVLLIKELYKK
ncbi:DUF6115 domain-containing protein [Clostridium amazonitimonense]|uniref:DUF6115 domain-containing protein n=1 Tax=Clostridium amazonitimonense TaxID=1499689 RepID=UPI000509F48E|nr:hypothetical protein [Clostridium amazonitimonense]